MEDYSKKFKKKIKLLERKEIAKGTVLTLYQDKVDVNGDITYWDYLKNSSAASIIPVLPNGDIVMVRQYRLAPDKWTLELPAGKLDSDTEDFCVCAKRELEEETGYKSDDMELLIELDSAITFWDSRCKVFVAKNLYKGTKHFDEYEELNTEIWSIEDLKKEILNQHIIDGKTVAGLMAYIVKYNI